VTRFGPALAAFAAGLPLPASAAADSSFSLGEPLDNLDVRANHVAWTVTDRRGRDQLHGGFAETAHELPVPPAAFVGGLDLGSDRRGRTVLVYARCARRKGGACDLYLYNPRRRRQHRLASVSRPACRETGPHIDRGLLVFARRGRCSRGLFLKRPGQRLRRVMRQAPAAYDFAGRLLAFERREPSVSEIRLLRIGRHRSRPVRRETGSTAVRGPRLDGRYVYWQRSRLGPPRREDILRRPLRAGRATALERAGRAYAGSPGDELRSFAVYRRRLFYLLGSSAIGRVDPAPVFR